MGKGDKRTRRGKIAAGSFGKTRPKKKNLKKNTEAAQTSENKTVGKKASPSSV
jgi:30S ribosomal protein S31